MRDFLGTILVLSLWVGSYVGVRTFFFSIKRSALHEQPRQDGVTLEFFPTARMQVLIRFVLALLAAFGVLLSVAAHKDGGILYALYGLLVPGTVFLLILLARPVSVAVDDHGIRQRRWFLPDKGIKWADITSVEYGKNTGTTYVLSKNGGPKIRFSIFLVGRVRFKHEIRTHAPNADIYSEEDN